MTNLALGLAHFALWLVPYTHVDLWIEGLVGFDLRHFVAMAILILFWATFLLLLKRMRVSVVIGPMYFLLALANVLSLLTFPVHAYHEIRQAKNAGANRSIEEMLAPPDFSMTAEYCLRAASPIVKVLLVVSTVALVIALVKSFRQGGPKAA
jgi:hypothetical protein